MDEVEVKILNIDPAHIRKLLKQHKAKTVKKVLQRNTLYHNAYTKEERIVLRIREEGKHAVLTVKGKRRVVRGHKVAEEHEMPIDAPTTREMIRLLGFEKAGTIEMKREYYSLRNCSVEIIKLPSFPEYMEIEGKEKDILAAAKLLGFTRKDYVTDSIFKIFGIEKGKDLRF